MMATAGHIKGLKVDGLKTFLLNHDDVGEDYTEDIEKLAKEKYNGKLFLKLNKEKLDNDLKVTKGFRDIVLGIINSTDSEETDSAGPSPKKPRIQPQTLENNFFFCMTGYKNLPAKAQMRQVPPTRPGAFIPLINNKPAVWSGYKELRVKFLYDDGVNPENYDTDDLIKLANTWHDMEPSIPQFRLARDGEAAEIRVKLNRKGIRHSYTGIEAEGIIDEMKDTMELDVHTNITADKRGQDYKKHLVIHEFGHALGLSHEHQRSDFWTNVRAFIDIGKMQESIKAQLGKKMSDSEFEEYWKDQWDEAEIPVAGKTTYDRDSVMHYWLRKDWFDWNKYESKRAVLNSEVEATMEAIKDCKFILAPKPSQRDLGLLHEYYGGKDSTKRKATGPPGQDLEDDSGERIMKSDDIGDLMKILGNYSNKWNGIGMSLGFSSGELDVIKGNPSLFNGAPRSYLQTLLEDWVMWPNEAHNTQPTLSSLCNALRGTLVGLGALANDVEKSF